MTTKNKKLYLISCSKTGSNKTTKAKDMYISELFRKSYAYAKNRNGDIFVLSAKYGLLDENDVIEPYDETMNEKGKAKRVAWSESVAREIVKKYSPCVIVILAGKSYYQYLKPMMESNGYTVELPLDGMGIGQRLKYLKENINE